MTLSRKVKKVLGQRWPLDLIGLSLFIFVLYRIDIGKSINMLMKVNIMWLSIAAILVFPLILAKAYRWKLLLKAQDIDLSLWKLARLFCIGLWGGFVAIGQLGDFIKVIYLKNEGFSLAKSFMSVFIDRIFDLVILIIFAYAGIFILPQLFHHQMLLLSFVSCIVLLVVVFVIRKRRFVVSKVCSYLLSRKFINKTKFDNLLNITIGSREYLLRALLFSFIPAIIYLLRIYLLAVGVNIDMPYYYLIACIAIASIVSIIPISICGIGTRDAALVFLFSLLGENREAAVSLSLLMLLMMVINGLIGYFVWTKYPIKLS